MPQDGSNNYQYPPGTPGVPDTTIESNAYNAFLDDLVVNDLNIARPIHRGGTGAVNAHDAMVNLSGEIANQGDVRNFDTFPFIGGSFWSSTGATGGPPTGGTTDRYYLGIAYAIDANNITLEARGLVGTTPDKVYVRQKQAGIWGAWTEQPGSTADLDARYVNVTGDTMGGALTVTPKGSTFGGPAGTIMTGPVVPADANIKFYDGGGGNWSGIGVDANGNLWVRTGLSGTPAPALYVDTSQFAFLTKDPTSALGIATKQYVDNTISVAAAPFDALAYNGMQINGSMEISQENGATAIANPSVRYIVDGWVSDVVGALTTQGAQIGPGVIASLAGFPYANRIVATVGGALGVNDYVRMFQRMEGWRVERLALGVAAAQPFTIGFWVFATVPGTGTLFAQTNSGDRSYLGNFAINSGATWEYKTITVPAETTGGASWLAGASMGLRLGFCFGAGANFRGTNNTWNASNVFGTSATTNFFASNNNQVAVTGVVVVPGTQAPSAARAPFIMRPFDQELVTCQRYFEQTFNYGAAPGSGTNGGWDFQFNPAPTGTWMIPIPFKVRKRAAPSVTLYDGTGAPNCVARNVNGIAALVQNIGESGCVGGTGGGSGSEMFFHWRADARL